MKELAFYALIDKINRQENPDKTESFFDICEERYGISHAVYASLNSIKKTHNNCLVIGTYSKEWLAHYFANNYICHDPVSIFGMNGCRPFDWRELPRTQPIVEQIFHESIEFGMDSQGIGVPITGPYGEKALLSFNAPGTDREWTSRKDVLIRELQIIAQFFHNFIVPISTSQSSFPLPYSPDFLTAKELECLKWAATGKTVWETSAILSISERTVRFHLDEARKRLTCTTKTQAVAKAVATGLVNVS